MGEWILCPKDEEWKPMEACHECEDWWDCPTFLKTLDYPIW